VSEDLQGHLDQVEKMGHPDHQDLAVEAVREDLLVHLVLWDLQGLMDLVVIEEQLEDLDQQDLMDRLDPLDHLVKLGHLVKLENVDHLDPEGLLENWDRLALLATEVLLDLLDPLDQVDL